MFLYNMSTSPQNSGMNNTQKIADLYNKFSQMETEICILKQRLASTEEKLANNQSNKKQTSVETLGIWDGTEPIITDKTAQVPSSSEQGVMHTVTESEDGNKSCTCKGYIYNHRCKHLTSAGTARYPFNVELIWRGRKFSKSMWEEFIENGWDNEWGDYPSEPDDDKQYIGSNAEIWVEEDFWTQHKNTNEWPGTPDWYPCVVVGFDKQAGTYSIMMDELWNETPTILSGINILEDLEREHFAWIVDEDSEEFDEEYKKMTYVDKKMKETDFFHRRVWGKPLSALHESVQERIKQSFENEAKNFIFKDDSAESEEESEEEIEEDIEEYDSEDDYEEDSEEFQFGNKEVIELLKFQGVGHQHEPLMHILARESTDAAATKWIQYIESLRTDNN